MGAASNVYTKTTFTATASQTTFTLNYNIGYVDVYLNGVKLTTSDYTASNGTSVVLGVAAALNDIVETIAWTTWAATNTAIGAGTGTSLALNGATLGSNALAVTGTAALSGLLTAAGGVSSTLTTDATSASTGSIITAGGISCQKAAVVGTSITFNGFAAAGTVTAASTTDLSTSIANRQSITGNTTITSFGTGANYYRIINFTGNPLITYNATTLITPTAANIQAAAGDMAVLTSDGSGNWTIISYTRGVAPLSSAFAGVSNGTAVTYTSLSLTPGKWLLSANAVDNSGVGGGSGFCGIGTTAASPTAGTLGVDYITYAIDAAAGRGSCALMNKVVTLTATTTYYCSGLSTASYPAAWGNFRAQPIY